MQSLKNMIEKYGVGIGNDIVKVDYFLNHRIDSKLLFSMADEVAKHFEKNQIDAVLTVEASGIALACAVAHKINDVPVLFAKKSETPNQSPNCIEADVYSFTHKKSYKIRINKAHLQKGSNILIVDDFLADGEAVKGLRSLIRQAECSLAGVAIAIEKGFQKGGFNLRQEGVDLLSLATVKGIEDGKIILED